MRAHVLAGNHARHRGQPPTARGSETASEACRFGITPSIWLAGLDGEVSVRAFTTMVDASFIDILESSDSLISFQGHFEARYGR
jgi:hypothetical protein